MRVGAVLVALTAVNVYVFFFRDDTAVHKVLQPSSTGKSLTDDKASAGFETEGNPERFEYDPSPVLRYIVAPREDGAWQARKEDKPIELRTVETAAVIDSSLYESVHKAGESAALGSLLVDLFAWDINFY